MRLENELGYCISFTYVQVQRGAEALKLQNFSLHTFWMTPNGIDDNEDYGSDIMSDCEEAKKMKVGTKFKFFFQICAVNILVYEKMTSFCENILIT